MSDLEDIKQKLRQLSRDAYDSSAEILQFEHTFSNDIARIKSLVGNTATGTDIDLINLLDAATQALQKTVGTLQTAAKGCDDFAGRL